MRFGVSVGAFMGYCLVQGVYGLFKTGVFEGVRRRRGWH